VEEQAHLGPSFTTVLTPICASQAHPQQPLLLHLIRLPHRPTLLIQVVIFLVDVLELLRTRQMRSMCGMRSVTRDRFRHVTATVQIQL
jgi:hypothetical protein